MSRYRIAQLLRRLACLIAGHQWQQSRFVPLNCMGPSYMCHRCHKVIQYD